MSIHSVVLQFMQDLILSNNDSSFLPNRSSQPPDRDLLKAILDILEPPFPRPSLATHIPMSSILSMLMFPIFISFQSHPRHLLSVSGTRSGFLWISKFCVSAGSPFPIFFRVSRFSPQNVSFPYR